MIKFQKLLELKHAKKWIILVVNPPKRQALGALPSDTLASSVGGLRLQTSVSIK